MAEQASEEVWVVTALGRDRQRIERGLGDVVAEGAARAVPLETLKVNMQRFLGQLREILATGDEGLGSCEP